MFGLFDRIDWDKYFCYDTKQITRIQDRYLGFTLYFLYALITAYIILGVFYFGEGYLSYDQTIGGLATHVKGDAIATSSSGDIRYYSAEEITYLGLENGNVFVATRETVQKEKRGDCEDVDMPCNSDGDCSKALGGTCLPSGHCKEPSWCPEGKAEAFDLHTKDLQVWAKSFIHYSLLDRNSKKDPFLGLFTTIKDPPFIFSTTDHNNSFPQHGFNLFSVDELLHLCKPIPVRFEEVAELGAVIEVVFSFNCDVQKKREDCKPTLSARRLDVIFDSQNIGFSFKWAEPISDTERIAHRMRGVRIFFRTVGIGSMVDTNATILKLATTTSLMCLAPIISDLFMLYVFTNKDRYNARKLDISPDFGDYQERMEQRKANGEVKTDDDARLQEQEAEFHNRMRELDED